MKVGKPFKDFKDAFYPQGSIAQYFGVNHDFYKDVCPVEGKCLEAHNGIDMVSMYGTPIQAVQDGFVIETHDGNINDGYGKFVKVRSKNLDGEGDLEWTYGHLSQILVTKRQVVAQGDILGNMGNTGLVNPKPSIWNPYAGTHLHLGCRRSIGGVIQDYGNGYFGSFDFKDMLPNFDPINDDIVGFVELLRKLLIRLQSAGIPLQKP